MFLSNYLCEQVVTIVYKRARLVLNETECIHIYGICFKTEEVSGTVVSVKTV